MPERGAPKEVVRAPDTREVLERTEFLEARRRVEEFSQLVSSARSDRALAEKLRDFDWDALQGGVEFIRMEADRASVEAEVDDKEIQAAIEKFEQTERGAMITRAREVFNEGDLDTVMDEVDHSEVNPVENGHSLYNGFGANVDTPDLNYVDEFEPGDYYFDEYFHSKAVAEIHISSLQTYSGDNFDYSGPSTTVAITMNASGEVSYEFSGEELDEGYKAAVIEKLEALKGQI